MAPLDKKGVAAFQYPRNWHTLVTIKSLKMHKNTLSQEKMLNITHYQRNANQNHNEVPFHASQNGCDPKVYKQ